MVSAIVTFGMIFLLVISGRLYEAVRRFVSLIVSIFFKIANLFGIQVSKTEVKIFVSKKFLDTFEDIRVVKKSKQNNKLKSSINIFALILLILSAALIACNLDILTGNIISKWLFENNPLPWLITSQRNMDMTFTATLFSCITFAISKLINQWKETAPDRRARREIKKRERLLYSMSSKDLLDAAKAKDQARYEALIAQESIDN